MLGTVTRAAVCPLVNITASWCRVKSPPRRAVPPISDDRAETWPGLPGRRPNPLPASWNDGVGGADFTRGTSLAGPKDRVEAIGGRISLDSPRGAGTSLHVELPITVINGGITISDVG